MTRLRRAIGVQDENGNYRITGRIKDMIIRGGENIYPTAFDEAVNNYVKELVRMIKVTDNKEIKETVLSLSLIHI